MHKRQSRTHKLLSARRGRIVARTKAVVETIGASAASGGAGGPAVTGQLQSLRSDIRGLRRDVAGQPGSGPKAAASALGAIDASLATLLKAQQETDGPRKLALLSEGLATIQRAQRNAKRAGRDWAL